jgi:hypothetical protein
MMEIIGWLLTGLNHFFTKHLMKLLS